MSSPVRISPVAICFFTTSDLRFLRTTVTCLVDCTDSAVSMDFDRSTVRRDMSLPNSSRMVTPQATSKKIESWV